MELREIDAWLSDYVAHAPTDQIDASYALSPDIAGTPLFDVPLVECASQGSARSGCRSTSSRRRA